jgi:hypothetical protein
VLQPGENGRPKYLPPAEDNYKPKSVIRRHEGWTAFKNFEFLVLNFELIHSIFMNSLRMSIRKYPEGVKQQ